MNSDFKKKVFDEDLFQFSLELMGLIEKFGASAQTSSDILRKTIVDAFATNNSLQDLHTFIRTLNQLSAADFPQFFKALYALSLQPTSVTNDFLTTVRQLSLPEYQFQDWDDFFKTIVSLSSGSEALMGEYLMTVRHLGKAPFVSWADFFKTTLSLTGADPRVLIDFSMTIRHLLLIPTFTNWPDFFKGVLSFTGQTGSVLNEFLMTLRHLAEDKGFSYWEDFFKASLSLAATSAQVLNDFAMTVRHLTIPSYRFSSWDEFFKSIIVISSKAEMIIPFLTTVRHSLNYFNKPDTFRAMMKTLSAQPQLSAFEAYSYGQLESKKWLIDETLRARGQSWGTVFILAGWIGSLAQLIFDSADVTVEKIRSFDLDGASCKLAEKINNSQVLEQWKFKAVHMDISQMKYPTDYFVKRHDGTLCELSDQPDLVINTSCEHIENLNQWWSKIPVGTAMILQNNNAFQIKDHINCVSSLEEFKSQLPLSKVDFAGELALADYTRYMLIGVK
jgi:hypothetical protein